MHPLRPTRTATGPGLFDDPTNPLLMLQLIRRFNPHDREMTGNSVRNFYDSEGYFKSNYQGASSAYDFLEAKRTQWEHLVSFCDRANDEAAGSVIMMTERERVIVLMSTIHAGYRTLKRRIDLGELPAVITMIEFTNFINKYEITAEELRPKLIPQRKIFATTKSEAPKTVCRLVGHTPGHEYGGLECNIECKIKMNKKESYAETQRNDVKRLTGSNDKKQLIGGASNVYNVFNFTTMSKDDPKIKSKNVVACDSAAGFSVFKDISLFSQGVWKSE